MGKTQSVDKNISGANKIQLKIVTGYSTGCRQKCGKFK